MRDVYLGNEVVMMLLSFENVTSYYGKTPILKDISFDVREGRVPVRARP